MGRSSSKRILLIDGEPAVHDDFRASLRVDGQPDACPPGSLPGSSLSAILEDIEVDSASHGPEGWNRLHSALESGRPYVLAVVDLDLAGEWDGVETVLRLWAEDSELPVLLIAAEDCPASERRERTRPLGQIDRFVFLSKPLDPGEVRRLAASQADRRLARDELRQVTDQLRRALRRTREEAEAAGRAKSEFMANISHEIRTPMNAILGFTRLLMKEPLNVDQLEKLHFVREAGQSLLSLIDNVLDYAKLAAGQLKLSTAGFNLPAVLDDVLCATRPAAGAKGLVVQHHMVEAVPRLLRGDKTRLRQILVNLVSNAIKFTDHGTIHVQTTLDEQTEHTATLRFVVTDTGVGIPVERQAIIFESFSQADGSSTRQFEGVGLGLSICKQLVDLMGGQIGFRSDPASNQRGQSQWGPSPGKGGSSFWLTLTLQKYAGKDSDGSFGEPTARAEDAPYAVVGRPASARPTPGGKPHVLVAEDDHLNRTLAEMLLTRAGCLVDLAGNGVEALAMLKRTPYDMVLMDVEMPKLDGLKVIEEIRRQEADTGGHVPIITLTARAMPGDRQRCLDAGADQYVSKPFTPEMLIDTVRHYLPGCLESDEALTPAGPQAQANRSHEQAETWQNHLRALADALRQKNFWQMENSAVAVKRLSQDAGWKSAADHAMRVLLAARSSDLEQAGAAMEKLQTALRSRPALLQPKTDAAACHGSTSRCP